MKLKDIAEIVTEKIDYESINLENYVSVDNLLQNKNGKCNAAHMPAYGKYIKYRVGDILLGNIRPYLKKIWLSDTTGAAKQDVIVLRPKNNISSWFIYSLLSDDNFFEYVSKGSIGTIMPMGDKKHILNYEFLVDINNEKISNLIKLITTKIFLNRKINDNLL
ncbi:hypothetical protein LNO75_00645 [Mycoplasma sp. T363T]|uniref:hypothetical protein n=1 Tax=Mycoplasma bradburyae TaxID=2963128 RepID=UPI002341EBBF|nr:hypothetical protein [Mycoplasma bradburyae]MDC4163090.1 hypothetical protein [Mycoplasma bradburyae]